MQSIRNAITLELLWLCFFVDTVYSTNYIRNAYVNGMHIDINDNTKWTEIKETKLVICTVNSIQATHTHTHGMWFNFTEKCIDDQSHRKARGTTAHDCFIISYCCNIQRSTLLHSLNWLHQMTAYIIIALPCVMLHFKYNTTGLPDPLITFIPTTTISDTSGVLLSNLWSHYSQQTTNVSCNRLCI